MNRTFWLVEQSPITLAERQKSQVSHRAQLQHFLCSSLSNTHLKICLLAFHHSMSVAHMIMPQISQNIQKMQQLASFVRFQNKNRFFTNYQKSSRWWKSFESRGRLVDCRLQRLNCGWKVEGGGWRMRILVEDEGWRMRTLVEDGGWTNIW